MAEAQRALIILYSSHPQSTQISDIFEKVVDYSIPNEAEVLAARPVGKPEGERMVLKKMMTAEDSGIKWGASN